MNAQDLLNTLLNLQLAGVDLNQLDVVCNTTVYDGLGQAELVESWPETAEVNNSNELVLF